MSRAETLIAAIAKNATYVANLDAAAKKKPLTAKQKASRASAVAKFDAYVAEYAGLVGGGTAAADPFPGKSMVERRRAWNDDEAQAAINAKLTELGLDGADDIAAQIEALGPDLGAKFIALGGAGAPGTYADVDYGKALPVGGFWGVSSGRDEGDGQGGGSDWGKAWNGSKAVNTYRNRGADPVLNNQEIARLNGLDIARPNRPADDYSGEFTAPVTF